MTAQEWRELRRTPLESWPASPLSMLTRCIADLESAECEINTRRKAMADIVRTLGHGCTGLEHHEIEPELLRQLTDLRAKLDQAVAALRKFCIYQPHGSYYCCKVCGATWWGDRKYGDSGERHNLTCELTIVIATLRPEKKKEV